MSRPTTVCCRIARNTRSANLHSACRRSTSKSIPWLSSSSSYATQAPVPAASKSPQIPPGASTKSTPEELKCSPKINEIVTSISQLTLLEAADLVQALKSRLNITEIAMPVQAATAPSDQTSSGSGAETKTEKAEPEKPKEKTTFNLTLTKIDATNKAKVIKEVKTIMPNMNLVEAKKFVESLPKLLKENGTKDEIEKLKKALEAVGATVQIE